MRVTTAWRMRCSALEQANELVAFAGNPALEPLYVVNPFERGLAALSSRPIRPRQSALAVSARWIRWKERVEAA